MEDFAGEIAAVLARPGDPELYYPTFNEKAEIELKGNVFAEIAEAFPVSVGKHASNEDRGENNLPDATLTYGEVVLSTQDFTSLAEVFSLIKSRYGGLGTGVFYDLGSVAVIQGSGKGVIAGAVLHQFEECRGIEILPGLHRVSLEMKAKYDSVMPGVITSFPAVFPRVPTVSFFLGSFFNIPFSDACCFFANSTCFSLEMMQQIADVPLALGTIAITLTKNLPGSQWLVLESFRKKMSWGEATVYIHRRVDPAVLRSMKASYPETTYWYS